MNILCNLLIYTSIYIYIDVYIKYITIYIQLYIYHMYIGQATQFLANERSDETMLYTHYGPDAAHRSTQLVPSCGMHGYIYI